MSYSTRAEVRDMVKDDALNAIIGDTFIEDPAEREELVSPIIDAAIKFLTLVAEGTVSIGTETEDPASAAAGGFKVKSNSRLFTREKMRGM